MTTESKKLLTTLSTQEGVSCPSCRATPSVVFEGFECGILCDALDRETVEDFNCGAIRALVHDAVIAHEQRKVIADLHWALEASLSYERHGKRGGTRAFSKANAEKLTAILSAAAPYILED